MIRACKNDTITVEYTGTLEDGTVFDRSPEDRPLRFILGRGEVIPGFEAAIEGLYQGESKTVSIACADAYGDHKPERVEVVERALLPDNIEPQPGRQLEVTRQDGTLFHVMVVAVDETTVTLDANHPLAGKDLSFALKLLKVEKPQT